MKAELAIVFVLAALASLIEADAAIDIGDVKTGVGVGRFQVLSENPATLKFQDEIQARLVPGGQDTGPLLLPMKVTGPVTVGVMNTSNWTNSTNSSANATLNSSLNSTVPGGSRGAEPVIGSTSGGGFNGFWGMEASKGGIGRSGIKSRMFLSGNFDVDKTVKFTDRI